MELESAVDFADPRAFQGSAVKLLDVPQQSIHRPDPGSLA